MRKYADEINESFPDEQVLCIEEKSEGLLQEAEAVMMRPWFADFANYVVSRLLPHDLNFQQKKKFLHDVKDYFWEEPSLFKLCKDQIMRKCVPDEEQEEILKSCHDSAYGGHASGKKTAFKAL